MDKGDFKKEKCVFEGRELEYFWGSASPYQLSILQTYNKSKIIKSSITAFLQGQACVSNDFPQLFLFSRLLLPNFNLSFYLLYYKFVKMSSYHHQPNKISRLDELLSRNQIIYQNLKSRLLQINKSSEKINANISNIKPLYHQQNNQPYEKYEEQSASKIQIEHINNQMHREELVSPKFHEVNQNLFNYRESQKPIESSRRQYSYQHLASQVQSKSEKSESSEIPIQSPSQFGKQNENQGSFSVSHQPVHTFKYPQIKTTTIDEVQQLDNSLAQSYVFVPFNKLFRSPTMTIKKNNEIIVARKSKTQILTNGPKAILDGIKYRSNNIITDEDQLLKRIYACQSNIRKIGLIGGSQCLKKKLHMDILSYVFTGLTDIVMNKEQKEKIEFLIEHQEAVSGFDPQIIQDNWEFGENSSENRINLVGVSTCMEEIFALIKKKFNVGESRKVALNRIRVTKLQIFCNESPIDKTVIMSSNKVDSHFLSSLALNKIVWCINPLYKYHDESIQIFEEMKKYDKKKADRRIALRKLPYFDYCNQEESELKKNSHYSDIDRRRV